MRGKRADWPLGCSATAIIIASLAVGGCGGSTARSARRVVTINALDDETRATHTARLRGEMSQKVGGKSVVYRVTGELNFDQDAMHVRSVAPDGTINFEIIAIGRHAYARGTSDQGLESQYCAIDATEELDPGSVLQSLRKSHATLQRVGDETVDGTSTTRYHVVTQFEALDIWVDANDRLRRMATTGDMTSTADLYDFGAPIDPIQAPSTKGCPPSIESSVVGSSELCTGSTGEGIEPIPGHASGPPPSNWETMTPQQLRKLGWRRTVDTPTSACQADTPVPSTVVVPADLPADGHASSAIAVARAIKAHGAGCDTATVETPPSSDISDATCLNGGDVIAITVYRDHNALVATLPLEKQANCPPDKAANPTFLEGENWIVSPVSEQTTRRLAAAIGGTVVTICASGNGTP